MCKNVRGMINKCFFKLKTETEMCMPSKSICWSCPSPLT